MSLLPGGVSLLIARLIDGEIERWRLDATRAVGVVDVEEDVKLTILTVLQTCQVLKPRPIQWRERLPWSCHLCCHGVGLLSLLPVAR